MKWRKAMSLLATRDKVSSAAVFDLQGSLLSRTENFAEKQEHVDAVLNVLTNSLHLKLVKLNVFGDVFTCVCPGQDGILLADSGDRLFVAVRMSGYVIIAFSNEHVPGSCLYEVMEFRNLLKRKVH